jgi:hypothetical protein
MNNQNKRQLVLLQSQQLQLGGGGGVKEISIQTNNATTRLQDP